MHRVLTLTALTALSLVACSSSESAGTDTGTTRAGTSAVSTTASTSTSASTTTSIAATSATASPTSAPSSPTTADPTTTTTTAPTGAVSRDDLVRFIAATETVLEGTPNEGVVYEAPEIYIAIGQAACARFTAGDSFEEVANDLLVDLASASADDDTRLVGAILGAATQTICPEHADLI